MSKSNYTLQGFLQLDMLGNELYPVNAVDYFANIAGSTADGIVATFVQPNVSPNPAALRVYSVLASIAATTASITFNSKPAGAGTAISATFTLQANGLLVLPYNPLGWFTTSPGQGLSVATNSGTVSLQVKAAPY